MNTRPVKLMLLGIGVLLFVPELQTVFSFTHQYVRPDYSVYQAIYFIVPIIGLVLLLVGFFLKPRP